MKVSPVRNYFGSRVRSNSRQ